MYKYIEQKNIFHVFYSDHNSQVYAIAGLFILNSLFYRLVIYTTFLHYIRVHSFLPRLINGKFNEAHADIPKSYQTPVARTRATVDEILIVILLVDSLARLTIKIRNIPPILSALLIIDVVVHQKKYKKNIEPNR